MLTDEDLKHLNCATLHNKLKTKVNTKIYCITFLHFLVAIVCRAQLGKNGDKAFNGNMCWMQHWSSEYSLHLECWWHTHVASSWQCCRHRSSSSRGSWYSSALKKWSACHLLAIVPHALDLTTHKVHIAPYTLSEAHRIFFHDPYFDSLVTDSDFWYRRELV